MRRGDVTLRILEIVEEVAGNASDVLSAFLSAGYGASVGKLNLAARRHRHKRELRKVEREARERVLRRYYVMMHHLRIQGLLAKEDDKGKFFLTVRGKRKLKELRGGLSKRLPEVQYQQRNKSAAVTIVSFDIPEKERRKRAWLRAALKNLGLRMVHQSLWIGKVKLPKKFLDDLLHLRLVEFIEIFEVTRSGSLSHVL